MLIMRTGLPEVLNRLENITGFKPVKHGDWYEAVCPSHPDSSPSLRVTEGRVQSTFMVCLAGCMYADIKTAIERNIPLPNKATKKYSHVPFWQLQIVKTYDYLTATGQLAYQKVRFEPKTFALRHMRGKSFKWGIGSSTPILYRLPEIIPAKRVFVVEGEKNVDALVARGAIATCNYDGGGNNKWRDSYTKVLVGKEIVIIPDNDVTGLAFADHVAAQLAPYCQVRIVRLPGLAYKQDVYDWFILGNTLGELQTLIEATAII